MNHATTRATILPDILRLIMKHCNLSEQEALHSFYTSAIGEAFADDESGLYGQSPLYIFGEYLSEKGLPVPDDL